MLEVFPSDTAALPASPGALSPAFVDPRPLSAVMDGVLALLGLVPGPPPALPRAPQSTPSLSEQTITFGERFVGFPRRLQQQQISWAFCIPGPYCGPLPPPPAPPRAQPSSPSAAPGVPAGWLADPVGLKSRALEFLDALRLIPAVVPASPPARHPPLPPPTARKFHHTNGKRCATDDGQYSSLVLHKFFSREQQQGRRW